MEFGIGMFGDLSVNNLNGKYKDPSQRLSEMVEEIKLADELGLDVVALGEHHRPDYSISSPEIVLAALSTVTKRIKLASGVTVLSSADPVKVYQDFASIDLLSGGRAEIIAGRGSFIESFPLFGYNLNDYDALFAEKLDLLLELNKDETITWKGQFRAELKDQQIHPRALNNRELPIWLAVGGTPQSVHRAATLGIPMILAIIGGQPAQFLDFVNYYKRIYETSGHDGSLMQLGVHSHAFVTEDRRSLTNDYYPAYAAQMDRVGKSRGWPPYRIEQFEAGLSREGALFMGEPEMVALKMINLIEMFGLTRFVAHMDVGDPGHDQMMKSIELFATKVVPMVKAALPLNKL